MDLPGTSRLESRLMGLPPTFTTGQARLASLSSRDLADTRPTGDATATAEDLETGPTRSFARDAAVETGIHVHASLFERSPGADGLSFNTAILIGPDGTLLGRLGCMSRRARTWRGCARRAGRSTPR
ncbi:nitrilase-related carbon-nitrogen hydrolase [Nonomuraea basaltis]|uniref:nitrilase-related carbon-nitrogen hydrolase n=1 Tax=Nonomuraea basaltis TaxID=2495887 RepID=UPI00110C3F39|nr:nitrilase-related carbon-nitrogen hydrolase [Nonomuraea basaltis]TMR89420.1 hypothetical protein EJK15_60840 [Nonomuraea basaltis]